VFNQSGKKGGDIGGEAGLVIEGGCEEQRLVVVGGRGEGPGEHSNILIVFIETICEIIHMLQMP
jgi:hypothetical protein